MGVRDEIGKWSLKVRVIDCRESRIRLGSFVDGFLARLSLLK